MAISRYTTRRGSHPWGGQQANKYGAKEKYIDGIRFASKHEAAYYEEIKLRKLAGEIENFHRQVIVDLGGGVTHRIDYLLLFTAGGYEYVEIKGYDTDLGKAKRKIAESILKREITLVTRDRRKNT